MRRLAWFVVALAVMVLVAVGEALVGAVPEARACGCFAPPNPTVPVIQAGEKILFAVKDSVVTAHIQIRFQGDASDFGWLVPLPSLVRLTVIVPSSNVVWTAQAE